jgi:hypothetical protein
MLTAGLLTTRTPEAHEKAVKEFATFRSGGQFLPIGLDQETVVFPCFLGGAEWGGPAVDRTRGVIYVNANEAACVLGLTENQPTASTGERIYHNQCSLCHGKDLPVRRPTILRWSMWASVSRPHRLKPKSPRAAAACRPFPTFATSTCGPSSSF